MSEESTWPNCKEVQCEQAHSIARLLLQYIEEECPENIYIVGKMVRLIQSIDRLKSERKPQEITSAEFVKYWDGLDFSQHCLLAAQSLLRAASLVQNNPPLPTTASAPLVGKP